MTSNNCTQSSHTFTEKILNDKPVFEEETLHDKLERIEEQHTVNPKFKYQITPLKFVMASQTYGLVQDQNSIHYNATQAGKPNGSRTIKKGGGLGNRKPLGDLSNAVDTTKHQALKKQNNVFSFTEQDPGVAKRGINIDSNKKKSLVKEKKSVTGRKPLSNISNSAHSLVHEMSKKNLKAKVVHQEEVHLDAISEEGFLHDHGECMKAQENAMDMDKFLQIIGLNKGFSQEPASAWSFGANKVKDEFELEPLVLEEKEWMTEDGYGFGQMELSPPRSPSPSLEYNWNDDENVNFELAKSPVLGNF